MFNFFQIFFNLLKTKEKNIERTNKPDHPANNLWHFTLSAHDAYSFLLFIRERPVGNLCHDNLVKENRGIVISVHVLVENMATPLFFI